MRQSVSGPSARHAVARWVCRVVVFTALLVAAAPALAGYVASVAQDANEAPLHRSEATIAIVEWASTPDSTTAPAVSMAPGTAGSSSRRTDSEVAPASPRDTAAAGSDRPVAFDVEGMLFAGAVPEPATVALLFAGLAALVSALRRRRWRRPPAPPPEPEPAVV